MVRRQHEQIRRAIEPGELDRPDDAAKTYAVAEPKAARQSPKMAGERRVAHWPDQQQPPGEATQAGERAQQHILPLARRQAGHAEQSGP